MTGGTWKSLGLGWLKTASFQEPPSFPQRGTSPSGDAERTHCRRNFLLVGRSIRMEECPLAIYQNQNMKKALVFYSNSRKHSICFPFFPTTVLKTKLHIVYSGLSLFSLKLRYLFQWFSLRQYSKTPCFLIGPLEQLQNQASHNFVDRVIRSS